MPLACFPRNNDVHRYMTVMREELEVEWFKKSAADRHDSALLVPLVPQLSSLLHVYTVTPTDMLDC